MSSQHIPVPSEGVAPPAYVVSVKNDRLYIDKVNYVAVISQDNKVVGDVSMQLGEASSEYNQIFSQRSFRKPVKLDGPAFPMLIGGSGDSNYFHWMFDVLPRLHLLQESGWSDAVAWYIVPRNMLSFQQDTLRLLGLDASKIIEGHKYIHIQADVLIASTFVRQLEHIPAWTCDYLRGQFLPIVKTNKLNPALFYISRSDSSSRIVENEQELIELLQKHGFATVVIAELSFMEQVSLFATAQAIVAPHGAGLTNIVFCNPGTAVLELFTPNYIPTLYADLASKVNLNHSFLICDTDSQDKGMRSAMQQNMKVDLKKIELKIQELLKPVLTPA